MSNPATQVVTVGNLSPESKKKLIKAVDDAVNNYRFSRAIAAHEMGHAQLHEGRSHPFLVNALSSGAQFAGLLGTVAATALKKPAIAAISVGAGYLPEVIEEIRASSRAMDFLRKSGKLTPDQLKDAKNILIRAGMTYGAGAVGSALGAYGAARLVNSWGSYETPYPFMLPGTASVLGGAAGSYLSTAGLLKKIKKDTASNMDAVKEIKEMAKIDTPIVPMKPNALDGNSAFVSIRGKVDKGTTKTFKDMVPKVFHPELLEMLKKKKGILLDSEKKTKKAEIALPLCLQNAVFSNKAQRHFETILQSLVS